MTFQGAGVVGFASANAHTTLFGDPPLWSPQRGGTSGQVVRMAAPEEVVYERDPLFKKLRAKAENKVCYCCDARLGGGRISAKSAQVDARPSLLSDNLTGAC